MVMYACMHATMLQLCKTCTMEEILLIVMIVERRIQGV
jgi:hypothetical protein